jgi:anti-sigma B factor antagonist
MMIQPLSFNVSRSDGSSVVAVAGEIDMATAPELAKVLGDFAQETVIVDFSAVTFIDSSGLATLAEAHQRIGRAGGQLAVDRVQPCIQKVFEITRLTELFRPNAIDA